MKPIFQWLSPAGARAPLSVLIFHRVLREPDPLFSSEVCARRFDALLGWVKLWFNVLPLDEAAQRLAQGTLPARAACLTFDDGYADNHDVALPLLRQHGLPCSFFIATGFLNGGRMWNDTLIEAVRCCRLASLDLRGLRDAHGDDLGVPGRPHGEGHGDVDVAVRGCLGVRHADRGEADHFGFFHQIWVARDIADYPGDAESHVLPPGSYFRGRCVLTHC